MLCLCGMSSRNSLATWSLEDIIPTTSTAAFNLSLSHSDSRALQQNFALWPLPIKFSGQTVERKDFPGGHVVPFAHVLHFMLTGILVTTEKSVVLDCNQPHRQKGQQVNDDIWKICDILSCLLKKIPQV